MRVTSARPLNPAALAFVPFGIVLVRVRVPLNYYLVASHEELELELELALSQTAQKPALRG